MRFELNRVGVVVGAAGALVAGAAVAAAQTPDFLRKEAMVSPTVKGAPFSGEGLVTLKLMLYDGTKIERTVPAKYFRDSQGRVRREQTIMGLAPLVPTGDMQAVVTIVDPVAGYVYTMIGNKREAQRMKTDFILLGSAVEKVVKELNALRPKPEDLLPPGFGTKIEALSTRDIDTSRNSPPVSTL